MRFLRKLPSGHWFASPGAILVIICFFLPWVLFSCGEDSGGQTQYFTATGIDAAGGVLCSLAEDGTTPGRPLLWLVHCSALIVIVISVHALTRDPSKWADGYALVVLGAFPLALLVVEVPKSIEQVTQRGLEFVQLEYGLKGVVIGQCAIMLGGLLNLALKLTATEGQENTENGPTGPGSAG